MDVGLLKSTWQHVGVFGDEVPQQFYARLFLAHPEVRPLFPASMASQRDRLVKALARIVTDVEDADRLAPFLRRLGYDHAVKYGIKPEHYPWVGEALLETLAYFLGSQWTTKARDAWVTAYSTIAEIMVQGASETPSDLVVGARVERTAATRLTPENIRTMRFPRATWWRRGYQTKDVDALVALVIGEFEQRIEDAANLRNQLHMARTRVDELQQYYRHFNSDLESVVNINVATADAVALMSRTQLMIDQLMESAQRQAEGAVTEVRRRCQDLLQQAMAQQQGAADALSAALAELGNVPVIPTLEATGRG